MRDIFVLKLEDQLRNHIFLQRCRSGDVTDHELMIFLAQHGKYGLYFTRYLCALMANLTSLDDVIRLAGNLFEEFGLDEMNGVPHSIIYNKMLHDFGISLQTEAIYPQTKNLINTVLNFCKKDNPTYGLGALCLGVESTVPTLYSDIIIGFQKRHIKMERINFFKIHVDCDDGHADTMREILERICEGDPHQRQIANEAAQSIVSARLDFFTGVMEGAQRS